MVKFKGLVVLTVLAVSTALIGGSGEHLALLLFVLQNQGQEANGMATPLKLHPLFRQPDLLASLWGTKNCSPKSKLRGQSSRA